MASVGAAGFNPSAVRKAARVEVAQPAAVIDPGLTDFRTLPLYQSS